LHFHQEQIFFIIKTDFLFALTNGGMYLSAAASRMSSLTPLLLLLGFGLIVAAFIHATIGYGLPTPECLHPAVEFGEHHRISSDFLPVGYSAFLGLGMMVTHDDGLSLANLAIYLLLLSFCWSFLRLRGLSSRYAALASAVVAVFPGLSVSIFKVMDSAMTAMFLFAVMVGVLSTLRWSARWMADAALAVLLGCAVMTRTNLLLLVPVVWLIWWRYGLPRLVARIGGQLVLGAATYLALTTAVHGRPFLPHNGPYNLFAGANEFTSQFITNEEDSLVPALAARGIHAIVDWDIDPNQPGANDPRDRQYERMYQHEALHYIRTHPAQTLERVVWRGGIFLMPDLQVHPAKTFGGILKLIGFAMMPLWLLGRVLLPKQMGAAGVIVPAVCVAYVLPFMLIVSSPRFRVPLEIVCLSDLLASVVLAWQRRQARAASEGALYV